MCFSMFLLGFILPGTLCTSWTWLTISFPMLGIFSVIISLNILLGHFSLPFPSGNPIMQMLVCLTLSQMSLRLYSFSFFFILFSIFCFTTVIYIILSSRSLICSSASVILLLVLSRVLFISCLFLALLGL